MRVLSCLRPAAALLALSGAVPFTAAQADSPPVNGHPLAIRAHRPPPLDPPGLLPIPALQPNAAAGLALPYSGTPIDVTTYHYDLARTGWNPSETDLTPATVASPKFGLLTTLNVDGNVFAEPLLVSNFVMPDKTTHNLLIVVTGHNSVYAYDAQTYAVLWHVNLGTPQKTADTGCADVNPEYGITSTPVIVRTGPSKAALFVVSATEHSPYSFSTNVHSLNLSTGQPVVPAVQINPSATYSNGQPLTFSPQNQWSRAGLVWANNSLYVSIGSHCDNNAGNISGWLLRYNQSLASTGQFHTIADQAGYELSSIWMAGFAPAVDSKGNLFVVTGNGEYRRNGTAAGNWGESVLRIAPSLAGNPGSFTPASYQFLNNADLDFGSGGVMLLPVQPGQAAPPMAVAMGKDAVIYLLKQSNLGGLTKGDAGALQSIRVSYSGNGLWGGPAFYNSPNGPMVYYQVNGDVLHGYLLNTSATPSLTNTVNGTTTAGYGGSTPIVSSNGTTPGTGVLWLVRRGTTVQLEAYDATNLGAPLYAAGAGTWATGSGSAFVTPLEANGRVYVPAYGAVTVFGLTP